MSIENSRSLAEAGTHNAAPIQRCRWWAGRQRDIIVDEGLPLL
jgi:hypothetical protein